MIKRCSNGHWYDTSTNRSCPHCKNASEKLSIRLDNVEEDDRTVSIAEVDLSLGEELGKIIGKSINNAPVISGQPAGSVDDSGDKTVSFGFFGITKIPPVTGWVVCMNGEEKGKDFRLHAGKNFIGRSSSMDIMLVDDKTVVRDRHGSLIYEPKTNCFYVSPENGNMVYLNGENVESPSKIIEGDEIQVGETTLKFMPFCRDEIKWDNEQEDGETDGN